MPSTNNAFLQKATCCTTASRPTIQQSRQEMSVFFIILSVNRCCLFVSATVPMGQRPTLASSVSYQDSLGMRRYRGDLREPQKDGVVKREQEKASKAPPDIVGEPPVVGTRRYRDTSESSWATDRKGSTTEKGSSRPAGPVPISTGVTAALGIVGATTIALKLSKYSFLGGSWHSAGAAAVISEDVALFVALFGLSYALRWGLRGSSWWEKINTEFPLVVSLLIWTPLVAITVFSLAFLGIEHIYFRSTSSTLDSDAIIVFKKSLGPIVFIALRVEGPRMKRLVLQVAAFLVSMAVVVHRLRRARATGGVPERLTNQVIARCLRSASALTESCFGPCVRPIKSRPVLAALPKAPVSMIAFATFVFISAASGPGLFPTSGDHSRIKPLRRNCFVWVAVGLIRAPSPSSPDVWASSVSAALSARIVGGITVREAATVSLMYHPKVIDATFEAERVKGARASRGTKKPNVVVVVLESTTGTLVTASNAAGVSPWAKELSSRGISTSKFYSSMPNTNKAMYQVLCGMTPSLETAWVEFERPEVLEAACLPGLLRSKLGYRSLLLTGSMVGGLGVFAHDRAIGFAGEEVQGGGRGFNSRKVHDKFNFEHGTFEKVNYLGYDDHVVLNSSISFLLDGDGRDEDHGVGGGGKLLTILTVGPHHFHDVPSGFSPQDFGPWEEASDTDSLNYKYKVALRYQDLFLERLYKQLDDTGLSENTFVVVVGDHGEAFNEHGFDKHGNNVYEEGIVVPFFLTGPSSDPRIVPGMTFDRVGMHADILPTLLDLLGLWKAEERHEEQNLQNARDIGELPSRGSYMRGGKDDARRRADGRGSKPGGKSRVATRSAPAPGSGLVGDSLMGPDYRGCAISATHYGGKTLAVVAGHLKGLFLYRWEKRGDVTHAEIEEAYLFDLSTDPLEKVNLVQSAGEGACCPKVSALNLSASGNIRDAEVSASCFKAVQYRPSLRDVENEEGPHGKPAMSAVRACCHLEAAAVVFASDNLEFFGRQGYEQDGEDKQPVVKRGKAL